MEVEVKDRNISAQDSMLSIIKSSEEKLIRLSDIIQFSEPKFDIALTIEGILDGTFGIIIGSGLLIWIFFPHLSMGG